MRCTRAITLACIFLELYTFSYFPFSISRHKSYPLCNSKTFSDIIINLHIFVNLYQTVSCTRTLKTNSGLHILPSYFPFIIFRHKSCSLCDFLTFSDILIKLHTFETLYQTKCHIQETRFTAENLLLRICKNKHRSAKLFSHLA